MSRVRVAEYKTIESFLADFELLKDNARLFNGETSMVTQQGRNI